MNEEIEDLEALFRGVLQRLTRIPTEFAGSNLLSARVVHDLGIAGDDFFELVEALNRISPIKRPVPERLVPAEASADAYYAACSQSWLANKIPAIRRWYISRISAPPTTLDDLYHILYE